MKILITGGTGFIGSNLIKFYKKDHTVIEYTRGDHLPTLLERHKPDLVINSAAEIYNKDVMLESNVVLTNTILEWIKNNPSTTMIQLGSGSELGDVPRKTTEKDPIQVHDMYSATKGMATLLCQGYAKSYNLDVVIIRPYSPFGPGEKPHRLFPKLWQSFKLNKPMDLVMGVHDFCYIDDFVEGLDAVVKSDKRTPGEIINISNGVQIENSEVFNLFRTITGKEGNVTLKNVFSTWSHWHADTTVINTKYNWKPKYNIEQGITKFLEEAKYE